uniref:Photosystem I assembly protein Ycf4 n=1 Tax=Panagrolaimus davidi TaxID=227884 RepID=A0A914PZH1_9BILA
MLTSRIGLNGLICFVRQTSTTFSTKVTEDSEKEKTKAVFPGENDKWTLVVGFPPGMYFQSIVTKMKFFYKFASALIVPWATYTYATGYMSLNWLAATYGSVLIIPLTLFIFSQGLNRTAAYILMDKNNENILITYFTTFLKLKQEVIPIEDIILDDNALIVSSRKKIKLGYVFQGFILSKKSNSSEWFYLPTDGCKIFHKEIAKRIFNNSDEFIEGVYKYKKK